MGLVLFGHDLSGTNSARHTNVEQGQPYYNTTLGTFDVYDGSAWRPANGINVAEAVFTETTGAGTYTGTVTVPAGGIVLDVQVHGIALWTATTSALMVVGDAGTADGFFTSTNLKATDLLAGEVNNFEHPGGKAGVYIASEQRVLYSATSRLITGTVVTVGAAGNAGRTRLVVVYAVPFSSAATKV